MPMRMRGLLWASCSQLNSSIISIISSAASTDRSQRFSSGRGAPKMAIKPSPTIWFTTPPCPVIASNISV